MIKFIKINLSIFIILFLVSCGFKPLYSEKNIKINIESIEYEGDKLIKKQIINQLSIYKNNNSKNKLNLHIKGDKKVIILSRDSKGNAKVYKVNVKITFNILEEGQFTKIYEKSNNYNHQDSPGLLKQKENKIVENLVSIIINELLTAYLIEQQVQ